MVEEDVVERLKKCKESRRVWGGSFLRPVSLDIFLSGYLVFFLDLRACLVLRDVGDFGYEGFYIG